MSNKYEKNFDDIYNREISSDKLIKAISNLTNRKAPGLDQILGEYVKAGQCCFIPYLLDLFNYLFKNGLFPDPWNIGIILPLHKSGDKTKPDNYRGITLMNVLSKLYTSIINNRLTIWANSSKKISWLSQRLLYF